MLMKFMSRYFSRTAHSADIEVVDGRMCRHGVIDGLRPEAEGAQKEAHDKGKNGPETPVAVGWKVHKAEEKGGVKKPDFIQKPGAKKDFFGQAAGKGQNENFFFAAVNEPEFEVAGAALNDPRKFESELRGNVDEENQSQANTRVQKPIFCAIRQRLEVKMTFAPAPNGETEAGQPQDSINKTSGSDHDKLPLSNYSLPVKKIKAASNY